MPVRLIDTSLLIRFFTRDDPLKADRVRQVLDRVETGQERVAISPIVVFETAFTLAHSYKVSRARIRVLLEDLLSLRGVQLPSKTIYLHALELYANHPQLSFGDAYNASYMAASGLTELYSYDKGFDRLPELARIET
ncbi:MAG: PIN domain-containing protein [Chloroflexi bacterium]|nr:PIN domain-containing protein [Chloroflexota bacterium]